MKVRMGVTKWYLGILKSLKDGICTISLDGFDSSHNIEVPENDVPSKDIIVLENSASKYQMQIHKTIILIRKI